MSLILYMSDLRINKTYVYYTQQAVAQKRSSCANIRYWWVEAEQDWELARWREEEGGDRESVIELERKAWRRIMGRELLGHFCWTGSREEFLQWCLKVEFRGPGAILWESLLAQGVLPPLQWPHKSVRSSVCSLSAVRLSNWSMLHLFQILLSSPWLFRHLL